MIPRKGGHQGRKEGRKDISRKGIEEGWRNIKEGRKDNKEERKEVKEERRETKKGRTPRKEIKEGDQVRRKRYQRRKERYQGRKEGYQGRKGGYQGGKDIKEERKYISRKIEGYQCVFINAYIYIHIYIYIYAIQQNQYIPIIYVYVRTSPLDLRVPCLVADCILRLVLPPFLLLVLAFYSASVFNSDLSSWDVSSVTSM